MAGIKDLEELITSGEVTLQKFAESWIERIAEDVYVFKEDLRRDLKFYGQMKDKWKDKFNFEECDKTILYILTHPDEAWEYIPGCR